MGSQRLLSTKKLEPVPVATVFCQVTSMSRLAPFTRIYRRKANDWQWICYLQCSFQSELFSSLACGPHGMEMHAPVACAPDPWAPGQVWHRIPLARVWSSSSPADEPASIAPSSPCRCAAAGPPLGGGSKDLGAAPSGFRLLPQGPPWAHPVQLKRRPKKKKKKNKRRGRGEEREERQDASNKWPCNGSDANAWWPGFWLAAAFFSLDCSRASSGWLAAAIGCMPENGTLAATNIRPRQASTFSHDISHDLSIFLTKLGSCRRRHSFYSQRL